MRTFFLFSKSLLFLLLSHLAIAQNTIKIHPLCSSNAVLQRDQPFTIWGTTEPRSRITVIFGDTNRTIKSNKEGQWSYTMPSQPAGGPHEILLLHHKERTRISNIYFGDVWIGSGQSNMEWTLKDTDYSLTNETPDSLIRIIKIPHQYSKTPMDTLQMGASWNTATPDQWKDFSAIGYHFAKALRKEKGVPIGFIDVSWGGSRIESWLSSENLGWTNEGETIDGYLAKAEEDLDQQTAQIEKFFGRLPKGFQGTPGAPPLYARKNFEDEGWKEIQVPGAWEDNEPMLKGLDGDVWLRYTFVLEELPRGNTILSLGAIDDDDLTYVNGQLVGSLKNGWNINRVYNLSENVLVVGENTIAIRISDHGGGGGILGKSSDIFLKTSKISISLAGKWKIQVENARTPSMASSAHQQPTLLYNAMIHPLKPIHPKGVLWYQGESNGESMDDAKQYGDYLKELIEQYRVDFQDATLPFLVVQLAGWESPTEDANEDHPWAWVREGQKAVQSLPNVATVTAIDIGDEKDIHPKDKLTVANRLAITARVFAYGDSLIWSGPQARAASFIGQKVLVEFDFAKNGLFTNNKYGFLPAFTIQDQKNHWHWAWASINETNKVEVWHPSVQQPKAVRYAWGIHPKDANLFNKEGLPALPFQFQRQD